MVYGEYLRDRESYRTILREEFGVIDGSLSSRIVVLPLPIEGFLPSIEDFLRREGIGFEWLRPSDPILGLSRGSLKLFLDGEPYYVLFIGRGSIEAVDRAWVISHDPGVKEVLFVGSAASLESRVEASSCNVPRYAVGVGDPSLAYVGLAEGLPVADEGVAGRVSGIAGEAGCRVYSLLHASVPYFYMETRRFLSYLSGVGVSTIDMELAYVLRVFDSMGKRAAGLVVVEDSPLHGVEYMSVGYERVRDLVDMVRRSVLPRVVVEFLRAG